MDSKKRQTPNEFIYSLKCGIASLLSTCVSVSSLHPFQLIKVRLQSHDGQANEENIVPKYRGIIGALRQIVHEQGYLGLYKGLSVTVISAAISSSLFFTFYETRKKMLLEGGNSSKGQSPMSIVLLASIQAGIGVICITQPMWVIKTRMLLNTNKNINQHSNLLFTLKQIKDQHGFRGYYKGFGVNLILSSNRALQMLTYEGSRQLYDKLAIPQSSLMQKNFICGGLAKIGNVLVIYPLTTIRTRIVQNQYVKQRPSEAKYSNVFEIISRTFKMEGLKGFYKGMTANLIRGIPQRSIFFYSYEIIKGFLISEYKSQ